MAANVSRRAKQLGYDFRERPIKVPRSQPPAGLTLAQILQMGRAAEKLAA